MQEPGSRAVLVLTAAVLLLGGGHLDAQHSNSPDSTAAVEMSPMAPGPGAPSAMWQLDLGSGWSVMGMAQAFPVVTVGAPSLDDSPLNATEWYLTQPAAMANLAGPDGRFVLRTTLNFEGVTQDDGELTFGGWGEGFLDRRHPHTLLHELVASVNLWGALGGDLSFSAGKGFAPYGTDDPMSRPGLKYPTNHHLSQVLERWFASAAWLRGGWGLEAALFGGSEPEGPYDFGNIESFGDSWSARLSRRWSVSDGMGGLEVSGSFARVQETHVEETLPQPFGEAEEPHDEGGGTHGEETITTRLWNGAVRYEGDALLRYALLEASTASQPGDDDFFSVLVETALRRGRHEPYLRVEHATRPEYERAGPASEPGFFRYDHDAEPIGATRWWIGTIGYGFRWTDFPVSLRPFVEVQAFRVEEERGGLDPTELFRDDRFWGLTLGARIFLGGDPMRMGAYGVLDSMSRMGRVSGMNPMEGM